MRKSRDISELGYSFLLYLCFVPWVRQCREISKTLKSLLVCDYFFCFCLVTFCFILNLFSVCLFGFCLFVLRQRFMSCSLACSSSGIMGMHHHARLTISHILIISSMPDSEVKLKREYDRSDRKYYIIMCDYLNYEHNFQGKNDAVDSRTEYTNSQWKKIILLKIQ